MIEQLQIQNFQSHKNTVLNFASGVNILTGTSGAGKSAIFRALVLAFQNRPLGTDYIRWGSKEAKVSLDIDGSRIERIRSKSKNLYVFDGMELQAGRDVPETIQDFLHTNFINIQHQIVPPFLLSNSPGEVAQFFNRLAGLSTIDLSMKNIQSQMRVLNKDFECYQQRETELKQELEKYAYLDQAENEITSLEQQEQRKEKLSTDIDQVQTLMNQIKQYESQVSIQTKLAQAVNDIANVESKANHREKIAGRHDGLLDLITDLKYYRQQTEYYTKKAQALQKIDKIESSEKHRSELQRQKQRLNGVLNSIRRTEKRLNKETDHMEKYQAELREKMPSTCPLCGQEVKNEEN